MARRRNKMPIGIVIAIIIQALCSLGIIWYVVQDAPPSYDAEFVDLELYRLIGELDKRLEPESISVLLEKVMDEDWRKHNLMQEAK